MAKKTKRTGIEELEYDRINWFPGHMNKAILEIKKKLKLVDIVLEIRDARSPLVTGNEAVHRELGTKPRLIILNKLNLADPEKVKLWHDWFLKQEIPFIFVNGLDKKELKDIVKLSKSIVNKRRLESNPDAAIKNKIKMMVIGLPNTGKSTIINKLANRLASKAADKPGQTRQQLWVNVDSELQILDTPGVMPPRIHKHEHGLWLSVLHAIPDHVVSPEMSACFLVEHLLKIKSEEFKSRYKMDSFDYDLIGALDQVGKVRGCMRVGSEYDYDRIYKIILGDFRSGLLGLVSFGIPPNR